MGNCICNKGHQSTGNHHETARRSNINSGSNSPIKLNKFEKQKSSLKNSQIELNMGNGGSVNKNPTSQNSSRKGSENKKSIKNNSKSSEINDDNKNNSKSTPYDSATNPYCLADVYSFDNLTSIKVHKPGWKEESNGSLCYNVFISEIVGMNLVKKLKNFPKAIVVPPNTQLVMSRTRFCGNPVVVVSIKSTDGSQQRVTIERFIHQLRMSGPREFQLPEASYDVDIGHEEISREQMEKHHRSISLKEIKPLNRE